MFSLKNKKNYLRIIHDTPSLTLSCKGVIVSVYQFFFGYKNWKFRRQFQLFPLQHEF